jgi:hypothetical protein
MPFSLYLLHLCVSCRNARIITDFMYEHYEEILRSPGRIQLNIYLSKSVGFATRRIRVRLGSRHHMRKGRLNDETLLQSHLYTIYVQSVNPLYEYAYMSFLITVCMCKKSAKK